MTDSGYNWIQFSGLDFSMKVLEINVDNGKPIFISIVLKNENQELILFK
jgi:hypothetical protein